VRPRRPGYIRGLELADSSTSVCAPRAPSTSSRATRATTVCSDRSFTILLVCARARRKNDPRWLLDQRIRRAEHSSRTVLPDPRMDHPTRLARELAALGTALCLCHVGSRTVVGQHAHIVMFVPAGERPREQRFDGCPSAPAGATSKYLTPTSRIPFGAVASRSYRRIGGSVTEKVVLSAWRT